MLSGSTAAAQSLLGDNFRGILNSDRYSAYNWLDKEKTPLAKTVRSCRQLLKVESALWLFVTLEGLEPTNKAAQRAIRRAVGWRRTSFGSPSEAGSVFVARMLSVVTSLGSENRPVLEFLSEAIRASREGSSPTCLLPQENASPESMPLAT
jgi:hypothetical protein